MSGHGKIEIWDVETGPGTRAALPDLITKARIQVSHVDLSLLSGNLSQVLAEFQQILNDQPKSESSFYYVDEIELNLGVSGNGSIALLGKLEAGVQASMKVKIKRVGYK